MVSTPSNTRPGSHLARRNVAAMLCAILGVAALASVWPALAQAAPASVEPIASKAIDASSEPSMPIILGESEAADTAPNQDIAAAAPTTEPDAALYAVASAELRWFDTRRNRAIPATLYYPLAGKPAPLVIFSHGLGRGREHYAYLGRYWAQHGIATLLVEHLGSDDEAWRGKLRPKRALREVLDDPQTAFDRPLDLRVALNGMQRLTERDPRYAERIDLTRVGVAGNDLGADAALAVAGARRLGWQMSTDPRVRALLAISPPAPQSGSPSAIYAGVHIPCMHMTGTDDDGWVGSTTATQRRVAFDHIDGVDQYLVTFLGGDHLIYSGHPRPRANEGRNDGYYQVSIRAASTAFWQAYLFDDAAERNRLAAVELPTMLAGRAALEIRHGQLGPEAQTAQIARPLAIP